VALPRTLKADLALAGVTLIWGSTFVVIKLALADVSPLVFVLLRFALAAALLLVIFGRRGSLRAPGLARAGVVVGLFLCAGFWFQTVGMQFTTPAKSAFITAMSVALVPVVLMLFFGRRPTALALAGVVAAAIGLYFLTVPPGEFSIGRGDLLTFICAIAFAGHIVAVGHYAPRCPVGGLAVWQVGVALVLTAAATPLAALTRLEAARLDWTPQLVLAIVITAALGIALAFSVQTWAQQFTPATHTAIIYTLEPVFAALTSYLVFAEQLTARGWLGAGLILTGVLLAELRSAGATDLPGMPAPANPSRNDSV
jgi:drug/metabolite transporter (DMT)-like permease